MGFQALSDLELLRVGDIDSNPTHSRRVSCNNDAFRRQNLVQLGVRTRSVGVSHNVVSGKILKGVRTHTIVVTRTC